MDPISTAQLWRDKVASRAERTEEHHYPNFQPGRQRHREPSGKVYDR